MLGPSKAGESDELGSTCTALDLQDLRLFGGTRLVDQLGMTIRCLLQLVLGTAAVILGDLLFFLKLPQRFQAVPAHVPNGDLAVFHLAFEELDHLLTALLGEWGNRHSDGGAVV